MRFKVGKCYKHSAGQMISIVAVAQTTMYGVTLLAEQSDRSDFTPCGMDADAYAENWQEISHDEWMTNFSDGERIKTANDSLQCTTPDT